MSDQSLHTLTEQDLRDVFNRHGMNYSQIVGDENTVVSCSLFTYNQAIKEILTLLNNKIREVALEVIGQPEPFKPALTQAQHWGLTEGSIERVLDNAKAMGRNELRAAQTKLLDSLLNETKQ